MDIPTGDYGGNDRVEVNIEVFIIEEVNITKVIQIKKPVALKEAVKPGNMQSWLRTRYQGDLKL